jgi:hypothetical protein
VDIRLAPWKARRPVSISYITAPSEKMSERASTGLPCACSGDMYAAVPTMTPSSVVAWIVRVAPSAPASSGAVSLARPKSRTLTTPFAPSMMLPGLTSRWTMPNVFAAANALAIGMAYFKTSGTGRPLLGINCCNVLPFTNSITMKSAPSA